MPPFDARLLLDQLPPGTSSQKTSRRDVSPSGWSDLPSDSEDTFFLEPSEIEAYTREKRRRTLDRDREARLRAIQDQEGPRKADEEIWGGSDEEPEEEQKELMNRTAKHLVSSPNPAQLEMRILANHGSDKRQEQKSQEDAQKVAQTSTGLGGLSGYGDSDSEESASVEEAPSVRPPDLKDGDDNGDGSKGVTEQKIEALKEARRARAKEWARSRREDKTGPM
ncbi:hypothetical protein ONZ45_g5999 [Pleurotus djamor]|nr:hypothetical protein ONZ45_g5999 [Pleurotus djamor]